MLTQITALREAASAAGEIAQKGLLARMLGARVHRQLTRLRGFVVASRLFALEWLVTGVCAHVTLEGLGGAELVMAFRALTRLVPSVRLHMSIQLRSLCESRAVRGEGETTASGPAADEAEGFGERRGVHRLDVRLQRSFCGECFSTGRGGGGVVPLADGDGEVGVGLRGRGEEGGVGGGVRGGVG